MFSENSHPLTPYNLWALRKVTVCPISAEDKMAWGHLTFFCLLVLIFGALGRGLHEIQTQSRERERLLTSKVPGNIAGSLRLSDFQSTSSGTRECDSKASEIA